MKLTYDPYKEEFMVGEETLREFYIRKRKESKYSISKLETISGVTHPLLQYVETGYVSRTTKKRRRSKSVSTILRALEALGVDLFLV